MEKEITLLEALTGVNFKVDFLDGTSFLVQNKQGEVIKPNTLMTIEEKGLPFHKNPYKFGNLFVLFTIKFPAGLDSSQQSGFESLFAKQKKK